MNLSRLAVLAVFFMMIMSAFVAVPTYNVGADDHEGGDDDGDGGPQPEVFHATMTMESLEDWSIDYYAEMDITDSDEMREGLAGMCADMLGTDDGEINDDCFNHWMEMMNSDGGEGGHDDEFRCPPDMDDETCHTIMECSENDSMTMDCFRASYNYCYGNEDSEMCEDLTENSDDEDNFMSFIWGIVAYENGHIDATTLMDEYIVPEFGDFMDGGITSDDDHGRPVLYDVQTFDVDSDGEIIIHTNFLEEVKTTPDFVCGSGSVETVPFYQVNDGNDDCEDGSDEQQYDDEGNEINWFDCHDGSEVWINQVNNWEWDCEDGEDEYQEHHNYWWGDVYLFEGDLSGEETDFGNLENVAFGNSYCDWGDDNETYVNCDDFMEAELFAGTWSLVTTGSCHQEWGEDDEGNWVLVGYDCHGENDNHTNMGPYSHSLGSDGEFWFANGSVNHESMEMKNFPYFDTYKHDSEEFVMYQTAELSVDTDFTVRIVSAGWVCYDFDEDGVDDDCWGQYPGLYIYHGEDLIASNKYYYDTEGFSCPIDSDDQDHSNCGYAILEVDLAAGDYTVYTTFESEASYYNKIDGAYVVTEGAETDVWDGHMVDNRWEWHENDGDEVMQTVAYNGSVYDLAFEEFWNEAYDFEWAEDSRAFEEEFGSVYDLYENYENVLETEGEGCDDCAGNLDTMDAETSFDITDQNEFENWAYNYDFDSYYFQFMDENENGAYDSGEIYAVSSEGGGNGGEEVLVEGTADRKHMPKADDYEYEPDCFDDEGNEIDCDEVFDMFAYIFMIAENATHYEDGDMTADTAADNVVNLFYVLVEMGVFEGGEDDHEDHGEDGYWEEYYGGYCEWEGDDFDGDTRWYCQYSDDEDWDTWWYYCEMHEDGFGGSNYYCTDDFGQSPDYEFSASNDHYVTGGSPEVHDQDDNPALLDGIIGIENPPDNIPVISPTNIVGALSDNEGLPMMYTGSFKLKFEGADASLETHEAYIPVDDGNWHVEMILLEGYEVKSCEDCEDLVIEGNNAKFNADEPVTVIFGKVDTSNCDAIVTIGDDGYSFEPADITIAAGDTVCWIWKGTSDVHNVAEVATKFDEDMNLEDAKLGFYSGEAANYVDFRHTFDENDKTHYYVCEPHASMAMVGTVTVGDGDQIQEIVEESGLPSIGFVVGTLALVGAAGLRRRIR